LGGSDVRSLLEEDLDDAPTVKRLAFDMFDVANRAGQLTLVVVDDPARHILRGQSVIRPNDCDDRNLDVGKNIGGRANRGEYTEYENQDRQNHEGVWPLQGHQNDRVHR
jgi:hypothetical protein